MLPSPYGTPAPLPAQAPILWDVVEEHLEEAAFLYTQWEQALISPLYKLEEVRDRVEERMLAHLDGLVVSGGLVAERLLLPALQTGTDGLAFAGAAALLLQSSAQADEAVVAAVRAAAPPQLAELQRALQLFPSARRQGLLLPLCWDGAPGVRAAAARVLGFQQVDLGPALSALLTSDDDELRRAGLYCLRYMPRRDSELAIRQALTAADGEVAAAGLLAGAVAGLPETLESCRFMIRTQHPASPTAALLLALGGSDTDSGLLIQSAAAHAYAPGLIFALGLCGNRNTADACVQWLRIPALAAAAGEAFVATTGVDPEKEKLLAPAAEDPDAVADSKLDPLAPDFEPASLLQAELAPLDADAVARWWSAHRDQFSASARIFRGQPLLRQSPSAWLAAMAEASMRQRHPLALGLASLGDQRQLVQTLGLCRPTCTTLYH